MALTEEFNSALRTRVTHGSYFPSFLPDALASIAVDLLGVEGASLSLLSDDLRMPLAASDDNARTAEILQFTLGDGPCLLTHLSLQTHALSQADLGARFPLYLIDLMARTPYRSVVTTPLLLGVGLVGALDLYRTDPGATGAELIEDARQVASLVTATLRAGSDDGADGPAWLLGPSTQLRAKAWIAIGLVSRAADLGSGDALDLIRGYAWNQGRTIDEVSYDLASHTIEVEAVIKDAPPAGYL